MTKRKLLIASPAKSGLPHTYVIFFDRLRARGLPGWDVEFAVEGAQHAINIARNILAHQAIHAGYDRMIQWDLDHPLDVPFFERLLSHDHDLYPIVSGTYFVKKPGKAFPLGIRAKGAQPDENGLLEARFLPTGFLSVSVDALKKIAAAHPDREFYIQDQDCFPALTPTPRRTDKTMTEFFPMGVNGPRSAGARLRRVRREMDLILKNGVAKATKPQMMAALQGVCAALTDPGEPGYMTGEDYHFSLLAYQAGIKQYIDLKCCIPHRGSIDYPVTDEKVICREIDPIPEHEGDIDTW